MFKFKFLWASLLIFMMTWTAEASAQNLVVTNNTGCNFGGRATWQVGSSCTNSGGAVYTVPAFTTVIVPIPAGLTTHFVTIYQNTPWALAHVSDGCAYPNSIDIMPMAGCVTAPTNVSISGNTVKITQ